jgi:hypothetical protein
MFSTTIDKETIQEVRNFLSSDKCKFVDNMNRAGLSFGAMALVIQAIEDKCNDIENQLESED